MVEWWLYQQNIEVVCSFLIWKRQHFATECECYLAILWICFFPPTGLRAWENLFGLTFSSKSFHVELCFLSIPWTFSSHQSRGQDQCFSKGGHSGSVLRGGAGTVVPGFHQWRASYWMPLTEVLCKGSFRKGHTDSNWGQRYGSQGAPGAMRS